MLFENMSLEIDITATDVTNVDVFDGILQFYSEKYKPMKIVVAQYVLGGPIRSGSKETPHHITGGDKSTDIFFIKPFESDDRIFYLDQSIRVPQLFRPAKESKYIQRVWNFFAGYQPSFHSF